MRLAPFAALALAAACVAPAAPGAQPAPPKLAWPVACEVGRSCEIQHYVDRDPGPGVRDWRCGHRTTDKHDAVDIRLVDMAAQRAGVDVLAAAAGRVLAVRDGVQDISIRAPGAPSVVGRQCGNRVALQLGDGWIVDYCHLAQGSLKVKVGDTVAAGQPLAHVGLSGDTEFPHLHFSVRHNNAVVDPFATGPAAAPACATPPGLWSAEAARKLAYKRGVVLNAGFAPGKIDPEAIEQRAVGSPTAASPALVAYARLIGLEAGDVIELALTGPDGKALANTASAPLDHDKDQWVGQAGLKLTGAAWPHGVYAGEVRVRRGGAVAITRRWQTSF
jgi:hypothetical protein